MLLCFVNNFTLTKWHLPLTLSEIVLVIKKETMSSLAMRMMIMWISKKRLPSDNDNTFSMFRTLVRQSPLGPLPTSIPSHHLRCRCRYGTVWKEEKVGNERKHYIYNLLPSLPSSSNFLCIFVSVVVFPCWHHYIPREKGKQSKLKWPSFRSWKSLEREKVLPSLCLTFCFSPSSFLTVPFSLLHLLKAFQPYSRFQQWKEK